MKPFLTSSLEGLRLACLALAILATLALFGVVAFNIVGRTVFDATGGSVNFMVSGAIELSQYALMVSIFAAIPAMLGTGLIRVDILSRMFPRWLANGLDRLWQAVIAAFAAILTMSFFELFLTALERGDQTQDLRLPLWPFYGLAALECAALTLLATGAVLGLVAPPQQDDA